MANGSTVLGKSVKIRGEISGGEDLVLDGELEGSLDVPNGCLTIGAPAVVRAHIVARDVIIHGKLTGDIHAAGSVMLRTGCVVQGNIYSSNLSIEQNASFKGTVDPSRAGETVAKAAPAAAAHTSAVPVPVHQPAFVVSEASKPYAPLTMPAAGAQRTFGQYPAALAAAAAAAANRSSTEPTDGDDKPTAPTLLFAEKKA